jgi:uncharacterized protein YfiM (DUF2279 family)
MMVVNNSKNAQLFFQAYLVITLFLLSYFPLTAQRNDSLTINKKKLRIFAIGSGAAYAVTLIGLNNLWYKNSPRQSFRFFNDNAEWKQVDKLGHFYSSFYLSYGTSKVLRECNLPIKRSDLVGALTGFLVLVPIEIFDGYSAAYGASAGDLLADAAGASFYLGQKLLWNETRLIPKFSFHHTGYAALRPNVLGSGNVSEILKDYNGQTYWLSVDTDKFIPFPKWLNIAVGYGAQGMVYARDDQNYNFGYRSYRQYYLSVDFDLSAIRTKSKVLKTLIFIAGMIKLPSPALEYSNNKLIFHTFYF